MLGGGGGTESLGRERRRTEPPAEIAESHVGRPIWVEVIAWARR